MTRSCSCSNSCPHHTSNRATEAYLRGRLHAFEYPDALPPCSAWLDESFNFDACARQAFLIGFCFTRALQPFWGPIDTTVRDCRCACGCDVDLSSAPEGLLLPSPHRETSR